MPERLADTDREFFRAIVSILANHSDWRVDENFGVSVEEAVDQAVSRPPRAAGELRLMHTETEGQLYVRIPDLGTPPGALEALLEQPLDPELDRDNSDFGNKIGEAHRSVADKYNCQYILPQANPYTVLVVSVPLNYNSQKLRETIDIASMASIDVSKLHERILESTEWTE